MTNYLIFRAEVRNREGEIVVVCIASASGDAYEVFIKGGLLSDGAAEAMYLDLFGATQRAYAECSAVAFLG